MNAVVFRKFVDRIAARARAGQRNSMHQAADVEIDGIRFILMDGSAVQEGSMFFLCEFGEVPEALRPQVLQWLLDEDLIRLGVGTPCFSIHHGTGRLILMGRVMIERVPSSVLFKAFVQHARHARQWRQTRRLLAHEQRKVSPTSATFIPSTGFPG